MSKYENPIPVRFKKGKLKKIRSSAKKAKRTLQEYVRISVDNEMDADEQDPKSA